MQIIKHSKNYKYVHPIFSEFERLYTVLSNNDEVKRNTLLKNDEFDISLQPFESIFNKYGNCKKHLKYVDKKYPQIPKVKENKKSVIVTFSGGKDSTATALYYKNKGYDVYLYHVHGVNRISPFEQQSAEAIAKYLNLPIIIEDVSLSGASLYPDHPLKNIIIANMALQWGIENNVGTLITAGDYSTAYLDDVCFETAGDDCIEMWNTYTPIIQQYLPQFKFETPLVNVADTLERLENDKKLLELAQSCVMAHRYKNYHHKRVENKYNIKLMDNRCGTCWKCALEYIYYTDHDLLEYNEEYYKYCLDILRKDLYKEKELRVKRDDVWEHYFFYDREDSKYYGKYRK